MRTVAVIGASRGLGRGAAEAFAAGGANVLSVARTSVDLPGVVPVVGDALDPAITAQVVTEHRPDVVVLVAGATPTIRPFDEQSWEEFSVNWEADVRLTHLWLGEVLKHPLGPGSRVIVISSGAAQGGSPLSGGYAGSKAMQRFLAGYAQDESNRRGLGITFSAVLPRITPLTDLGAAATRAYAKRAGTTEAEYLAQLGEPLTPASFGEAVVALASMPEAEGSFLLSSSGLMRLP